MSPVKQVTGKDFTDKLLQNFVLHFSDGKVKLISGYIQRIPYWFQRGIGWMFHVIR